VIDEKMPIGNLSPDSLKEVNLQAFLLSMMKKDNIEGSYTSNLGYMESSHLRDKLLSTKPEDLFKEIKKEYPSEVELSNL
jgi:hypothetical protein